ncbi:hypothetical protein BDW42DRAFT_161485 [Aspergillus taichungensis]|uniref:Uncharacterized protein n=1 Tax=Aspergillus taichungensis TaxID=482145 RepID=A0A2J5I596_9EURO|nr:hypothetical protein BDW42DRAFT_161485 [Aspergillus taichungensis]
MYRTTYLSCIKWTPPDSMTHWKPPLTAPLFILASSMSLPFPSLSSFSPFWAGLVALLCSDWPVDLPLPPFSPTTPLPPYDDCRL